MNPLQFKVLFEFRMLLFCSQRKKCHTLEGVHWLRVPSSRRKAPHHCFYRNCKVNLSSCGRCQKTGRALQIPNNFTDGCHFLQFQMIDSEFHSAHTELVSTMLDVAPLLAMLFLALISCQTSNTTLENAAVVSFSSCARQIRCSNPTACMRHLPLECALITAESRAASRLRNINNVAITPPANVGQRRYGEQWSFNALLIYETQCDWPKTTRRVLLEFIADAIAHFVPSVYKISPNQ